MSRFSGMTAQGGTTNTTAAKAISAPKRKELDLSSNPNPYLNSTFKADPYKAKQIGKEPLAEFDIMRKQVQQRSESQTQKGMDALKRRYAAMGGINSGSFIKQQQLGYDDAARRTEEAMQEVSLAEMQERQRRIELEEGKEFQSRETQKGYEFTSGENAAQRGSESWNAEQNRALQKYGIDSQMELDAWIAEHDIALKLGGLELQERSVDLEEQKYESDREDSDWAKAYNLSGLSPEQQEYFQNKFPWLFPKAPSSSSSSSSGSGGVSKPISANKNA